VYIEVAVESEVPLNRVAYILFIKTIVMLRRSFGSAAVGIMIAKLHIWF
jgi:hypothetical protein